MLRDAVGYAPVWLLGAMLAEARAPARNMPLAARLAAVLASVLLAFGHHQGLSHHNLTLPAFGALGAFWLWQEIAFGRWPAALAEAGEWSYSLYLVHPAAFYGTVSLIAFLPSSSLRWAAGLLIVLVASYAFFRVVEEPSHRAARSLGRRLKTT